MTPIYIADAFGAGPFTGNPAAVCFPRADVDDAWLADVAAEMNLSETAFLWPEADAWRLRWRTPTVEVDLCGHGTLASAHVLWDSGRLAPEQTARFDTRAGRLLARRDGARIELDFPATELEEAEPPPDLLPALGVTHAEVRLAKWDWLVAVADPSVVARLEPDHRALRRLGLRGVMVTAAGGEGADFVSRYFAPGSGIDEDPVTGSAHCALGPFWGARLGQDEMRARQLSPRGGHLEVALRGDRVALRGRATTVVEGTLRA